ncbi:MAG TPA: hypothetical protein VEH08_06980 [Methanomassiliicoccales archaeon]|nr:hypothetical protein [Methanomassiliicoccales archaeon]
METLAHLADLLVDPLDVLLIPVPDVLKMRLVNLLALQRSLRFLDRRTVLSLDRVQLLDLALEPLLA